MRTSGRQAPVPPQEIVAGWLTLRRWTQADLEGLLESVTTSLGHLLPWMTWAAGYDRDAARRFLERAGGPWEARDDFGYALFASEAIVGSAGLHRRVGRGGLEIGYWVDVRHTRRGIATLAAAALTEAGLAVPGVDRIEIHHDKANAPSRGVPVTLGYREITTRAHTVEAPGESGAEVVWRMHANAFPGSPAQVLLRTVRAR